MHFHCFFCVFKMLFFYVLKQKSRMEIMFLTSQEFMIAFNEIPKKITVILNKTLILDMFEKLNNSKERKKKQTLIHFFEQNT